MAQPPTKALFPVALLLVAIVVGGGAALLLRENNAASRQEFATVPELIERSEPVLDDRKQEVLADGVITLEEYNGAVEDAISCIEEGGLDVTRMPGKGVGGALQFVVEGDLRVISADGATGIHMGCQERHVGDLNLIWAAQNRPTAAQIADREANFDACVAGNGFPEFAGDRGALAVTLEPNSRGQWVYFGCLEGGADWRLPAPE